MGDPITVLDATATEWYANQLRLHEARAYDRKTPALTARNVFPVDSQQNPYAKSISFMSFDNVGEAKIISDRALDVPMGDLAASETAYPVGMIATGFDQSNWEIEAARRFGVDIEAQHVNAAFDRVNRVINSLAYKGDSARNIPGLFIDSDVATGAVTTGTWASATAAQILADITGAYVAHQEACNGAHEVDQILLPLAQYNKIATTRVTDYASETILQWLVTQLPFLSSANQIVKVPECDAAVDHTGAKDVMVLMRKDPECVELKVPQEIMFTAPRAIDLGQRTICLARCGGLHIHYPKSMYIAYGI